MHATQMLKQEGKRVIKVTKTSFTNKQERKGAINVTKTCYYFHFINTSHALVYEN